MILARKSRPVKPRWAWLVVELNMRRILTLAIVGLFAGMALAGCAGTDDTGGTGGGGAPQATVTASPLAPKVGEAVSFQASGARQGENAAWNFGDGGTGTGASTTHTYATPGQYIVLLTVTNAAGQSATNDAALTYLTVGAPALDITDVTEQTAPYATAASSAQVVQTGGEVRFDATGSGGWTANPDFDPKDPVQTGSHNPPFQVSVEGSSIAWDFGDGGSATGTTASHNFTQAGVFATKMTVTDATARTASYVITVRVLPQAPPTPGVRNPTVLTTATIGEPESLDPAYDYETSGGAVIQHVYDTLYFYKRDSADQLEPRLAAALPTWSADKTEATITLRPNVVFHNADTMTAEDVKFSLDRVILMNDPNGPGWILGSILGAETYQHLEAPKAEDRAAYLAKNSITVVNPSTVKIKLAYPDPAFLYKLAFNVAAIVSKEGVCENAEPDFVNCLPPPGETRHPWMDTHEVGSGPWTLEAWIPGQQVILKRFDQYWATKPTLEKVIIQKVGDINTRLLMVFSGQADDIYVPVDHDVDVLNKPNVRVVENPSWTVGFIGFNQQFCGGKAKSTFQTCMDANGADAPKGADGKPDPEFFADLNMRKAWTYAFDYQTYFNDILKGHGEMLNGPLPKGIFGFDANIAKPARDLTKAREFFGKTNHSGGFTVTIFYNSDNTVREKTANLLAQNLRELGPNVNVDVRGLDWSTAFLPKQRAQALPVFYLGWAPDYAFPDNYVVTFAHSKNGVYSKRVSYANAELDTLLDQLVRETDEAKLKTGYSNAVKKLNNDFVFLWLAQSSNFHVERDWVQGYYYNPMHSGGPNIGDYNAISKR